MTTKRMAVSLKPEYARRYVFYIQRSNIFPAAIDSADTFRSLPVVFSIAPDTFRRKNW